MIELLQIGGILCVGVGIGVVVTVGVVLKFVYKSLDINDELLKINEKQFTLIKEKDETIDKLNALAFKLNKEAEDWYAKCAALSQRLIQLDPSLVQKPLVNKNNGEVN